jgi:hypothetical protein
MGFEHSRKSSDRPILQKIRNDLNNTSIDRAIAKRYVRIDHQDQENGDASQKKQKQVTVTLPNGGKSKASRSKQRQTLGAIINGMTRALAKDKATPTRYRAEGIENAVKRASVLLPTTKKQPETETGKLLLLAHVLIIRILTDYLSLLIVFLTTCSQTSGFSIDRRPIPTKQQRESQGILLLASGSAATSGDSMPTCLHQPMREPVLCACYFV